MKIFSYFVLTSLLGLAACQAEFSNQLQKNNVLQIHQAPLTGKVKFPTDLKTHSDIESIRTLATVSLIYPADHPTQAHQTVVAGSTDANGQFSLNPSTNLTAGSWFILEASRRSAVGQSRQSLRTWVRRTASGWESFNSPIKINGETTALSALLEWQNLAPATLLASLDNSNPSIFTAPANGPDQEELSQTLELIQSLITQNQDPVATLAQGSQEILPTRVLNPQSSVLIETRHCPYCQLEHADLSGQDLNLANLNGANLSYAKLTNTTLINAQLIGAQFKGADFSGATWINGIACEAGSNGACQFEQRLNEAQGSWKERPRLSQDADGNLVVTWQSQGQDADDFGVYARRLSSLGIPQGEEFKVPTYETGAQTYPDVAHYSNGDFLITWQSPTHDAQGAGVDIYARRYAGNGTALAAPFRVNSGVEAGQGRPRVGIDAQDRTTIIWVDTHPPASIKARRFDPDLIPLGDDFQLNAESQGAPINVDLAMAPDGRFAIAWSDDDPDNSKGIYARAFDAEGQALIGDLHVNQHIPKLQDEPSIGIDATGNFTITWYSYLQDEAGIDTQQGGTGAGIYARRFDIDGQALSDEFRVNTTVFSMQDDPQIAVQSSGEFVISWTNWGVENPQDSPDVNLQRFDKNARPLGPETRVNTHTNNAQTDSSLILSPSGIITVAWESINQNGEIAGVYLKSMGFDL